MFPALQVLLDQSTKANSPLKGHERTVQYLQRLGKGTSPPDLLYCLGGWETPFETNVRCGCLNDPNTGAENLGIIFEFSPWVLKMCPEDGLKVKSSTALKHRVRLQFNSFLL